MLLGVAWFDGGVGYLPIDCFVGLGLGVVLFRVWGLFTAGFIVWFLVLGSLPLRGFALGLVGLYRFPLFAGVMFIWFVWFVWFFGVWFWVGCACCCASFTWLVAPRWGGLLILIWVLVFGFWVLSLISGV